MHTNFSPDQIEALVSPRRFASYVVAADGDRAAAVDLYRWNVALAASCFESFHYVEIIVRNAMDQALRTYYGEEERRIPWFLLPVDGKNEASFHESIERVRRRLREESRSDPCRRRLRILDRAPTEQPRGAVTARPRWFRHVERVSGVYDTRPLGPRDTVIVAAGDAWPLYQAVGAYLCQVGRTFRPVERIGFYADRVIKKSGSRYRAPSRQPRVVRRGGCPSRGI